MPISQKPNQFTALVGPEYVGQIQGPQVAPLALDVRRRAAAALPSSSSYPSLAFCTLGLAVLCLEWGKSFLRRAQLGVVNGESSLARPSSVRATRAHSDGRRGSVLSGANAASRPQPLVESVRASDGLNLESVRASDSKQEPNAGAC